MKPRIIFGFALLLSLSSMLLAQGITRCGGPSNALYINWPNFQFDLCHTGYNPYEHTLGADNVGDLVVDWKFTTGNAVNASPAVVNGIVYIGSTDYNFYALNATTGVPIWTYTTSGPIYSSAAVANGVVYFGSSDPDHNVYALNAATGALLWSYSTGDQIYSPPTVVDGTVFVGSDDGNLYALNAKGGTLLWKYSAGADIPYSPTVVNGIVYFGTSSPDSKVHALNAVTGAPLWTFGPDEFVGSATVFHGVVYIASFGAYPPVGGRVWALNAVTGAVVWEYQAAHNLGNSPALSNGVLYVPSLDNHIYALNANSGVQIWESDATTGPIYTAPTVANGVVYLTADLYQGGGSLNAVDVNTGKGLWSYALGQYNSSSPTVVNGVLYVGANNNDNSVYAFHLPGQ